MAMKSNFLYELSGRFSHCHHRYVCTFVYLRVWALGFAVCLCVPAGEGVGKQSRGWSAEAGLLGTRHAHWHWPQKGPKKSCGWTSSRPAECRHPRAAIGAPLCLQVCGLAIQAGEKLHSQEVMHSQVPGVGMWTSLERGIILSIPQGIFQL